MRISQLVLTFAFAIMAVQAHADDSKSGSTNTTPCPYQAKVGLFSKTAAVKGVKPATTSSTAQGAE